MLLGSKLREYLNLNFYFSSNRYNCTDCTFFFLQNFLFFLRNIYRLISDTALLYYLILYFSSNSFLLSYKYFGFLVNAFTFIQISLPISLSCKYFCFPSNSFTFLHVFLFFFSFCLYVVHTVLLTI